MVIVQRYEAHHTEVTDPNTVLAFVKEELTVLYGSTENFTITLNTKPQFNMEYPSMASVHCEGKYTVDVVAERKVSG